MDSFTPRKYKISLFRTLNAIVASVFAPPHCYIPLSRICCKMATLRASSLFQQPDDALNNDQEQEQAK